MVWIEYQRLKAEYERSQGHLTALLDKQEEIFWKTQPAAIRYDKDKVQTSPSDHITDLLVKSADLDKLIETARKTVDERQHLLLLKKKELRQSRDIEDKIYTLYFIDRMSVNKIAYCIGYSRSQVFRIVKKMRLNATFSGVE
jgi:DNA-directed RNA polymerase specialized sigma subunit